MGEGVKVTRTVEVRGSYLTLGDLRSLLDEVADAPNDTLVRVRAVDDRAPGNGYRSITVVVVSDP